MLNVYCFFHLNLMFSSIEENDRHVVIERCYFPLLELIQSYDYPIAIEIPAISLEYIQKISPGWISLFKSLLHSGKCQLIGSGYSQIIGPLVPGMLNLQNQRLGLETYNDLLGINPKVALINEQAYSPDLISIYSDLGYEAIIMEWNNPFRANQDNWDKSLRYYPQLAVDSFNNEIPLLWNDSIAFQKFQRFAHSQISLDEYISYIQSHCSEQNRYFPIYGGDLEIFDFRPGRFLTEAPVVSSEWSRIKLLFDTLSEYKTVNWIFPSQVLECPSSPRSYNRLKLETPAYPIPVKKQDKYNISRWALSGRDDFSINTKCYSLFNSLISNGIHDKFAWKDLCLLWSSDFRTHITTKRWDSFIQHLHNS